MNQEIKTIYSFLEKDGKTDYLVFDFDDKPVKVSLTDTSGQSNLKEVFTKILQLFREGQVKIEYRENANYKTQLYIDVCTQYIADLNKEIAVAYKKMPDYISAKKLNNSKL